MPICIYSSIQYSQTPLLSALLSGHNETADLLVLHGADLYQEDEVSHVLTISDCVHVIIIWYLCMCSMTNHQY